MDYHSRELAIALDPTSDAHLMPDFPTGAGYVLDVGCGAGQTLIAAGLSGSTIRCGVDVDVNALLRGRETAGDVHFVCARAEALPFRDDSFDVVLSRVALPYTNVPIAVREMARIVRTHGSIWLALHEASLAIKTLLNHLRRFQLKGVVFQLYTLINGASLHITGRLLRFPGIKDRYESFQTAHGMTRILRQTGLHVDEISRKKTLVMRASYHTKQTKTFDK